MDKRTLLFVLLLSLALFGTNLFFQSMNSEKKKEWVEQQKAKQAAQASKAKEAQVAAPKPSEKPQLAPSKTKEERFYVLENDYQQLVFSNRGAALAEINLPFRTKTNSRSVVREIQIDRDMVENHPYNAYFPSRSYYTPSVAGSTDFTFHEKGSLGGYYPLLRRNLITPKNTIDVKPQFYAMNLISEYPETAETIYEVTHFDANSITFEGNQGTRHIRKTFSFGDNEGPYCVKMTLDVDGESRGFWLTSGIPEVEWISNGPAPEMKIRITRRQQSEVEKVELPQNTLTSSTVSPDWICNSNGFLGMILDPITEIDAGYRIQAVSANTVPSRLMEINKEFNRFPVASLTGYDAQLPIRSKGGSMTFRLFAGPYDANILKSVDALYTNQHTGDNPDYMACQTMHGWFTFISEPFAKFLSILLNFFHYITNSWALSIILLTVSLRIMLYPLNAWSTKSMVQMQQIAPEVAAIQDKYKKDPKKAQMEVMALYREKGVNPASGCLPLLIQMPFLIGMFDLLKSSFSLRGAPFIPGWIDDLTAPDVVFSWNYPIFFIGTELHLLPILLGLVMFLQQRFLTPGPTEPHMMTDQQRQQRAMGSMTSVIFAVMFYHFPSGLNIYWLSSMLLGMLQQWHTTKKLKAQPKVVV